MTTGTPSAAARTSNSRPSQPDTASAAANAATVFSGLSRQSPRWARRSGRVDTPSPRLPDLEMGRDPQMVAREQSRIVGVGAVEHETGIDDADGPADPDVVQAPGFAVGVDGRSLEAGRPCHLGFGAVGLGVG